MEETLQANKQEIVVRATPGSKALSWREFAARLGTPRDLLEQALLPSAEEHPLRGITNGVLREIDHFNQLLETHGRQIRDYLATAALKDKEIATILELLRDNREDEDPVYIQRGILAGLALDRALEDSLSQPLIDIEAYLNEILPETQVRNLLSAQGKFELVEVLLTLEAISTEVETRSLFQEQQIQTLSALSQNDLCAEVLEGARRKLSLHSYTREVVKTALVRDNRVFPDSVPASLTSLENTPALELEPLSQAANATISQLMTYMGKVRERAGEVRALSFRLGDGGDITRAGVSGEIRSEWSDIINSICGPDQKVPIVDVGVVKAVLSGLLPDEEVGRVLHYNGGAIDQDSLDQLRVKLTELDFALNDPASLRRARTLFVSRLAKMAEHPVVFKLLSHYSLSPRASERSVATLALETLKTAQESDRETQPHKPVGGYRRVQRREVEDSDEASLQFEEQPRVGHVYERSPQRTTPAGLLVLIKQVKSSFQKGQKPQKDLNHSQTQLCRNGFCKKLPADEFVPAVESLLEAIQSSALSEPTKEITLSNNVGQAEEMLAHLIKRTPPEREGVPRLNEYVGVVRPGYHTNKTLRFDEVEVLKSGSEVSRDGLTVALLEAVNCNERRRLGNYTKAVVTALSDPADLDLDLLSKVFQGSGGKLKNIARLIWQAGQCESEADKVTVATALLYLAQNKPKFQALLKTPRECASRVASIVMQQRVQSGVTSDQTGELSLAMKALFDGIRTVAGPEAQMPQGSVRYAPIARTIYNGDFERECQAVLEDISNGSFVKQKLEKIEEEKHDHAFDAKVKVLRAEELPPIDHPAGMYLALRKASLELTKSGTLDPLSSLLQRLSAPESGPRLCRSLPAEQLVPTLLEIYDQVVSGSSTDKEVVTELLSEAMLSLGRNSKHGIPQLVRPVGVTEDHIDLRYALPDKKSEYSESRSGLACILSEMQLCVRLEAKLITPNSDEERAKLAKSESRSRFLSDVILKTLSTDSDKPVLPTKEIAPLDVALTLTEVVIRSSRLGAVQGRAALAAVLRLSEENLSIKAAMARLLSDGTAPGVTLLAKQFAAFDPRLSPKDRSITHEKGIFLGLVDLIESEAESNLSTSQTRREILSAWCGTRRGEELITELIKESKKSATAENQLSKVRLVIGDQALAKLEQALKEKAFTPPQTEKPTEVQKRAVASPANIKVPGPMLMLSIPLGRGALSDTYFEDPQAVPRELEKLRYTTSVMRQGREITSRTVEGNFLFAVDLLKDALKGNPRVDKKKIDGIVEPATKILLDSAVAYKGRLENVRRKIDLGLSALGEYKPGNERVLFDVFFDFSRPQHSALAARFLVEKFSSPSAILTAARSEKTSPRSMIKDLLILSAYSPQMSSKNLLVGRIAEVSSVSPAFEEAFKSLLTRSKEGESLRLQLECGREFDQITSKLVSDRSTPREVASFARTVIDGINQRLYPDTIRGLLNIIGQGKSIDGEKIQRSRDPAEQEALRVRKWCYHFIRDLIKEESALTVVKTISSELTTDASKYQVEGAKRVLAELERERVAIQPKVEAGQEARAPIGSTQTEVETVVDPLSDEERLARLLLREAERGEAGSWDVYFDGAGDDEWS